MIVLRPLTRLEDRGIGRYTLPPSKRKSKHNASMIAIHHSVTLSYCKTIIIIIIIIIITQAGGSGGGSVLPAFVCVSSFPHGISKTAAVRITKLEREMFHDESRKPIYFGVKRSKVKVTKRKKAVPVILRSPCMHALTTISLQSESASGL